MTSTAPRFRFLGLTDAVVTCDQCGRTELKRTVVLAVLDDDGNHAGELFYGSSCAARALSRPGRKYTAAGIRSEAEAADLLTRREAEDARATLAHYGPVEDDDAALVAAFRAAHSAATWIRSTSDAEILGKARAMFVRRRAQLAAADLLLNPPARAAA